MTQLPRPPANRVERRAIGYWLVRALTGWIVALAVAGVILLGGIGGSTTTVSILVALIALAAAHVLVMPFWRFAVHRWEITGDAVYTQRGWFTEERRVAPLSRIQTIDSDRGPFEQAFGLTNVTVTTASAAGPLKIHGLDRYVARKIVADLTEATRLHAGDAT